MNIEDAKQLIHMLKDRLEECCDCIESGYDIAREAGLSNTDAEMTVEGGRHFIEEANEFLKDEESESCNMPQ